MKKRIAKQFAQKMIIHILDAELKYPRESFVLNTAQELMGTNLVLAEYELDQEQIYAEIEKFVQKLENQYNERYS